MSIGIICDSASDIPQAYTKKLGLVEVPININFGDKVFKENVDISGDEYYKKLVSSDVFPTTSQPSPGSFSLQSPMQSICSKSFSLPYTKQKPSSPLLRYV